MTFVLHLVSFVLLLACIPLGVAVAVLALQVVAACLQGSKQATPAEPASADRPRIAILTPAHDEAEGIVGMLQALLPQLRAGDRSLVVADNCTDDTAALARAVGAIVVERSHATLRGKSFALAFGVEALRADPPDVVVVVDADCQLGAGSLDALAHGVVRHGRPLQALDLMISTPGASLSRRVAEFAWRVRNWVRPAGSHALGLPCQLMGTGMAFSWAMITEVPLANGSIAEDMRLGIDFALRGQPPLFCDAALVTSYFPDSAAATRTQRTRWEHGHLETIFGQALPILWNALRRRDPRLLGLALDLCVPPLALLAASLLAVDVLASIFRLCGGSAHALEAALTLTILFFGAAMLAWTLRGRDLLRLRELLSIPMYIVAKLPIYVRFLFRREKQWVRTERK